MRFRFLLLAIVLTATVSASAGEILLLNFELSSGASTMYRGKVFVTDKKQTWSKGLRRSYLKLRCEQKAEGVRKMYSTVDLFDGLNVYHQRVEDNVKLTVMHSTVKPRLTEIRNLASHECKEMSPVTNLLTQTYSIPVTGNGETMLFSENTIFKYTLQPIAKTD